MSFQYNDVLRTTYLLGQAFSVKRRVGRKGTMSEAIETFQIRVDDSILEDLRSRLERSRFPDQIGGTTWEYGIPIDYLDR
jgi:hypothetical protein